MKLRRELEPPFFDKQLVARLTELADNLDGSRNPDHNALWLEEFNREAQTNLRWEDFQGIYGAQDHEDWVQNLLSLPFQRHIPDISRARGANRDNTTHL